MSLLDTPLCELLGVRLPIVQAPMANASNQIDDGIVTVGFDTFGTPTGAPNHVKIIGNVVTGNLVFRKDP